MSQRKIETLKYVFCAGWDKLQYYFLVITEKKTGDVVFSNLNLNLDEIKLIINGFGVEPEPSFWEYLVEDKIHNNTQGERLFSFNSLDH